MPRKKPPQVTAKLISSDPVCTDRRLSDLYIRIIKRRLLESGYGNARKKAVLKAIRQINKEQQ